jgi:hypothetical protein
MTADMNKLAAGPMAKLTPIAQPRNLEGRVRQATAIIAAGKADAHLPELGKLAEDLQAHASEDAALQALKLAPRANGTAGVVKALINRRYNPGG